MKLHTYALSAGFGWVVILVCHLHLTSTCRASYYYWYPPARPPPAAKKNEVDKNSEGAWRGFKVPPEALAVWQSWYTNYTEQLKMDQDSLTPDKLKAIRGPGSGWPHDWQGMNGGFKGFPPYEPPPWGYAPINTGLPGACYDKLVKGTCTESLTRWAYNPYKENCEEFTYTGCDGNKNNFFTEAQCKNKCMTMPPSGCDMDTDLPMEALIYRKSARRCGSEG